MRLKIYDSHLTCKVANKCLNVRERVEVVEWNKRWSPPFPCCPVSCQCPWKKILIEKKRKRQNLMLGQRWFWIHTENNVVLMLLANTQRWFNVDICSDSVTTSISMISMLNRHDFLNVDPTLKFTVETKLTLDWH